MVTFSADDPGTAPEVWVSALTGAGLDVLDLAGLRRLVVVAAHPDDESLGAGGLLALAAAAGVDIDVIVATDGEASHPASPTHTPERLAARRRDEVTAAVATVAPHARLTLLRLPDGRLAEHVAELTVALGSVLVAEPTWLVSPWVDDGHPDHRAAGEAALAAAAEQPEVTVLQYPIWAWHWGTPDAGDVPLGRLQALPLTARALDAKRRALAAHVSQTAPLSTEPGDETLLPNSLTAFSEAGTEYFVAPPASDLAAPGSLDQGFFDDFYGDQDDPWQFESRWYEERKRDLTLASLPRRRFRSAFEPGCSIGVLTSGLAGRADRLLAADIAQRPLDLARRRLAGADHVSFTQLRVPQEWPSGSFDLVVLSEIGYYCSSPDLDLLIDRAVAALEDDGVLVACHWRHPVAEYPLRGDDVHQRLHDRSGLALLAGHLEADFRLDVFVRPPAVSVAGHDGLVG